MILAWIGVLSLIVFHTTFVTPEPLNPTLVIDPQGDLILSDKDGCIFVIYGQTGRFTLCGQATPKQQYETEARIAQALRALGSKR